MSTHNDSDSFVNAENIDADDDMGEQKSSLIESQDQAVEFSSKLIKAFDTKMREHNAANKNSKVSLAQLKQVYCSAVNSFDPTKHPENKNHLGFARINMFLNITIGKIPHLDIESGNYLSLSNIDIIHGAVPDLECWNTAKEDIQKFNVDYNFNCIDELYNIKEPEPLQFHWD